MTGMDGLPGRSARAMRDLLWRRDIKKHQRKYYYKNNDTASGKIVKRLSISNKKIGKSFGSVNE